MLPETVRAVVEASAGAVHSVAGVGGGDVSSAARVETASGPVFVKWGGSEAARTYAAEAEALAALAEAASDALAVPTPLAVEVASRELGVLVLPWLERGRPSPHEWRRFGEALAELHRAEAPGDGAYGWLDDNWIGSKPQRNGWAETWPVFFGERRLRAQAETVRQRGAWDTAWDRRLDRLVARLGDILPERPPPSLLHGDLW
ncbi:MAG: fructosamine kinase family protein, partial [Bacteroidota bacterium]